jgi:hypothetical protein
VLRGGGLDHRRHPADRRRLDRRVEAAGAARRGVARCRRRRSTSRCRAAAPTAP